MADENKDTLEVRGSEDRSPGGSPKFSWESPEFLQRTKSGSWYVIVGVIAIALAGAFYWFGLWSGSLVIIAAAVALGAMANSRSRKIVCQIFDEGIVVDGRNYRFDQFKSFWVIPGDIPRMRFDLTGTFSGEVTIPLEISKAEEVRIFVKNHLPENDKGGEDLSDFINRILRF